ncbi:hypothetical protein [Halotia branconii]|uniref:Uncharacterized protein n=1 Tax=Halotia branconii CENA392 TaxID=1539056 RepID=A0AAJ6PB79_9CYAN|nr:hypothetical protein [Halotia branconii]WGV27536.1 hypothetical protein QI031_08630 [Halotia branconii CENA392]
MADKKDEIKPNVNEAPTQDAQLAAENMASGKEQTPNVNLDADYAAAQKFSVSEIDQTGEGAAAAKAATAPKREVSPSKETTTEAKATGNPKDYAEMANEVGNLNAESATDVNDDLVKKALEKGERKK